MVLMFTYKASNILAVRKLEYTAGYVLPKNIERGTTEVLGFFL